MYEQFTQLLDDIGNHIFAVSMIIGAVTFTHLRVVRPIVRAARTVHDRWGDISEHEEAITHIRVKVDHIEGIGTETIGRVANIEQHVGISWNGDTDPDRRTS